MHWLYLLVAAAALGLALSTAHIGLLVAACLVALAALLATARGLRHALVTAADPRAGLVDEAALRRLHAVDPAPSSRLPVSGSTSP